MLKHPVTHFIILLSFILFHPLSGQGQSSDATLTQAITRNEGQLSTNKALAEAYAQKRRDLLVLGYSNPDVFVQETSAIMICMLNDQNNIPDLIEILSKDSLWKRQLNGSRNVTMQLQFAKYITTQLRSKISFDFVTTNLHDPLYDPDIRAQLINQLKAVSNH